MDILARLLRGEKAIPFDTYDPAQRVLQEPYEPFMGYHGSIPVADPGVPLAEYGRARVDAMWRTQPNVRKVVDFIARNVASIPLHVYERVSDTDRQRVSDHPLSDVIARPVRGVAPFRFWHSVLSDALLYDRWAVLKVPTETGMELVQIPSWRLRLQTDALRRVSAAWYWVGDEVDRQSGDHAGWRPLDLDALIFDHGYAPASAGLSPMETLADVLAETAQAVGYRRQVWQNGARVPAWIERPPPSVPGSDWSKEARDRFKAGFRAAYTGDGPQAGGVPLLEDGMKLHEFRAFSPEDTQDLEGRRLSSIEVASAFHIAPELVGAREGTYSNVDAFRQMLYRDSLGPYITAWEGALNAQLTPGLAGSRSLYVEAHVEAKLRGSFIEQAQIMQAATGAPWLLRNEARALQNRPPIEGGDDLVVPLNVLVGGQASPRDSGSQNVGGQASRRKRVTLLSKARPPETYTDKSRQVLSAFFARQARVVKGNLGLKADADWWDAERWDKELAEDLYRLAVTVSTKVAADALESIGFGPDAYDVDRTLAFLKAVSERVAGAINAVTLTQLEQAVSDDEDPAEAVSHVFEVAESSRAEQAAVTAVTTFAGFATTEAAKQVSGGRATKTWVTTSGNPRSSHARMNGETVGIDETFSNGAQWPGDVALDVDEVAGCECDVVINIP